ncbi:NifB/NifX family molybdenum-iron cluster-binding protein [Candidatus Micrarchaeota archaeon]|nr:NifB/NifX family molybdenum-iron cluster-binding protein [Candidatus Micrarchaeota archaeon]
MKVLISTEKGGLSDSVFPVFGRSPTFTIVNADKNSRKIENAKVIQNPAYQAGGGAGVAAAQNAINQGAQAIISGSCGPNALIVLNQAGIEIYSGNGNVKKAVESLLEGKLSKTNSGTGQKNFGFGRRKMGRRFD